MNKQTEALKLALSTLANARDWVGNDPEGRWDEDEMYDELCNMVKFVSEALADSALDRMAENARELGLDYEPAQKDYKAFYDGKKWYSVEVEPPCKTGSQCTSKCQQCEHPAQQQEPVAWRWTESNGQHWFDWRTDWTHHDRAKAMGFAIEYAYTSPPQRKPLTDEEILDMARTFGAQPWPPGSCVAFARAIEAKLKENT